MMVLLFRMDKLASCSLALLGLAFAVTFIGGVVSQACDDGVGTCENRSTTGMREIESTDRGIKKIDHTCGALKGNEIDWDCVFGPGSLQEVFERGGDMKACKGATKAEPCSRQEGGPGHYSWGLMDTLSSSVMSLSDTSMLAMASKQNVGTDQAVFVVPKEEERAEVKVKDGPQGFPFLKHQKYIFRYSFQAKAGMRVTKRFTHLGQLKGSKDGNMLKGDPIYSLTANNNGLMVRFSNQESIEDYHPGMEKNLDWDKATGKWVHVKITTVFGESMEVELSGAVKGKASWPKNLKPVAWHRDSEMVCMKLGLYHSKGNVHDQEVIYKNVSIEGPNGTIRTSNKME